MANSPRDSPTKSGEEPMAKENEPAKPANSGKAAPTSDDSTSGQENDAHRDEGTAVGSDGDIPSSNPAVHIESSGDGNNTNGIATSGVADDKAVDEGIQLQTEPQAKKKKKKKSKRKGGAARKNVTGFEGQSYT